MNIFIENISPNRKTYSLGFKGNTLELFKNQKSIIPAQCGVEDIRNSLEGNTMLFDEEMRGKYRCFILVSRLLMAC